MSSLNITIPIGAWEFKSKLTTYTQRATGDSKVKVTLSTANNSESNARYTLLGDVNATQGASSVLEVISTIGHDDLITMTSKTAHYMNIMTPTASVTYIGTLGSGNSNTNIVKLICAYL